MKQKRHKPEEIIRLLRECDGSGLSQESFARQKQISVATLHRWRKKHGQMDEADAKRLKALEKENTAPLFCPIQKRFLKGLGRFLRLGSVGDPFSEGFLIQHFLCQFPVSSCQRMTGIGVRSGGQCAGDPMPDPDFLKPHRRTIFQFEESASVDFSQSMLIERTNDHVEVVATRLQLSDQSLKGLPLQ